MDNYLNNFATRAEYNTYKASVDFKTPNTAFIEEEKVFEMVKADGTTKTWGVNTNEGVPSYSQIVKDMVENRLTSLNIPTYVTQIASYAFSDISWQNLSSVVIPHSVTTIGDFAFSKCTNLTSVFIPNSITTFRGNAFDGCTSLTDVTLEEGLTNLGSYTFYGCTSLTNVVIPSSVQTMGTMPFSNCSNLDTLTCKAVTPPTIKSSPVPSTISAIYVPAESVDAYKEATGWSNRADKIQAIPNE